MKKIWGFIFVVGLLFLIPNRTEAFFIVDTGAGSYGEPQPPGVLLVSMQDNVYAGRFYVSESSTITGIEGWLFNWGTGNGTDEPNYDKTLIVSLSKGDKYQETFINPHPTPTNQIFSDTFLLSPDDNADWHGLNGLNIPVESGYHWVAIGGPVVNSNVWGVMMPHGVSSPLSDYAVSIGGGSSFNTKDYPWSLAQNNGFRVSGGPVVPEPSTILLFGSGLLGAFVRRRKRA